MIQRSGPALAKERVRWESWSCTEGLGRTGLNGWWGFRRVLIKEQSSEVTLGILVDHCKHLKESSMNKTVFGDGFFQYLGICHLVKY